MDYKARMNQLGIEVPDILLPSGGTDLRKWAVVACDQYTSEPEYWKRVEDYVGDEPSTLHLIYPEVYLQRDDKDARIEAINNAMAEYQERDLLQTVKNSFVYIKRTLKSGALRSGLMMALDLERYSYERGSASLIRATEGTILDRLPPRIKIRKKAPIELPHIMVLINDKENLLFSALAAAEGKLQKLYDSELMENGGNLSGYRVGSEAMLKKIADIFETLHRRAAEATPDGPLLFAMGDGNHSFATAKSIWEEMKKSAPDHPARYALVEVVNIYDPGLLFEPIHRLLIGADVETLRRYVDKTDGVELDEAVGFPAALESVAGTGQEHRIAVTCGDYTGVLHFQRPASELAVANLDAFVNEIVASEGLEIDYIHGAETTRDLSRVSSEKRTGFILPDFHKDQLFPTVIRDGALPRKTFSMGEAQEKRYYMEARKIVP